jgi:hypothetical protein
MTEGRFRWRRAALVVLIAAAACSNRRDPIVIVDGTMHVENQTSREWRSVRVVVNHHYQAATTTLAPGGRLTVPLSQLQTAFGQKFDRGRQSVFKVVVTATDADGKPVELLWGGNQAR